MLKKKNLIGVLLSLTLLTSCLTACTSNTAGTAASTSNASASSASSAAGTADSAKAENPYAADGYYGDRVVLNVDGTDITETEYFHFMQATIQNVVDSYSTGVIDWTDMIDELTISEYVTEQTLRNIRLYHAIYAQAPKQGFDVTEAQKKSIDESFAELKKKYATDEEYQKAMKTMEMDEKVFYFLNTVNALSENSYKGLFGEGTSGYPKDADVLEYAQNQGYMHATYIFFSFKDADGNDITAAKKAEKFKLAKELVSQLNASSDPVTLFYTLISKYGEDTSLAENPTGYYFKHDDMLAAFSDAVEALTVNKFSDVIETSLGFNIVLRLPLEASKLVDAYCTPLFNNQLAQWRSKVVVRYTDDYSTIDPEAYYNWVVENNKAAAAATDTSGVVPSIGTATSGDSASDAVTSGNAPAEEAATTSN